MFFFIYLSSVQTVIQIPCIISLHHMWCFTETIPIFELRNMSPGSLYFDFFFTGIAHIHSKNAHLFQSSKKKLFSQHNIDFMPTRLWFFHNWRPSWISQNAQEWQVHTHLKTSTWTLKINNQKRKKLYPRLRT